ncbi:MAG: hypothetical protein QF637_09655 [Acidimicrobiales bacterium]|nr:hypothetical protein [Acidimicrobiales bacterium]
MRIANGKYSAHKIVYGMIALVALTAGCSLSSTASDSTTTLPTITTSAVSSESTTTDDAPSTTSAIQSAAERYGTTTETTTPPTLTNADTVTTAGLGPVRIGQTLAEAQEAAGVTFNAASTGSEACQYYTPAAGATGAAFMVVNGEVVRVDISSGPITSKSGYGIGATKEAIKAAFGSKIEESSTGDSVTFVPVTDGDKSMRVIWELDANGVVTSFRTGRVPHVTAKVGCSAG